MGPSRGANPQECGPVAGKAVRRRLVQLLVRMRRAAATTEESSVQAGLKHFLKVTKSYWPGLFPCYESADLPRTNNDLEHTFGSHRYHERRASGRRQASPGLVVMGSARVISSLATRLRPDEGLELRPGYVDDWQALRAELEQRRESRRRTAALPPRSSHLPRGVGATAPPAKFASLVFCAYAGSGLVIHCLARRQRMPSRFRATRMASPVSCRGVQPRAKQTSASRSSVHSEVGLPQVRGLWCSRSFSGSLKCSSRKCGRSGPGRISPPGRPSPRDGRH